MAINKTFKPLAAEFVSLLGQLINVRIKQFLQKHGIAIDTIKHGLKHALRSK